LVHGTFEQTNDHGSEALGSFKYLGTLINNSNDKTEESSRVTYTGPRNTMEETSLGKRRMEAPFEGDQSPEGAVAPNMGGWKQTGHEACTKEIESLQNVILKNNGIDHLRYLGVRGTILSQWIVL
jgi:hypothetical protein